MQRVQFTVISVSLSTTTHPTPPHTKHTPSSFQVLGRCFLTVMQVHFQFLSQALQKVQPVAQSCLAEALAQAQERCASARSQGSALGPLAELEEASHSWKGAAQVGKHGRLLHRRNVWFGIRLLETTIILFC